MARRELLDISRSNTFRSLRASTAKSDTAFVGLRGPSNWSFAAGASKEVSIDGISLGIVGDRGKVADLTSFESGDEVGSGSAVVADRRLDSGEVPESIDDRLGDFWCRRRLVVFTS